MKNNIFAIVVSFNPEIKYFNDFLTLCSKEFSNVIVVDNASSNLNSLKFSNNVKIIRNDSNLGIGVAQNIGIKFAINNGATHLVFFDQDSKFFPGFANNLLSEFIAIQSKGIKVGGVGPSLLDSDTGNPIPFINYTSGIKRRRIAGHNEYVKCFALLSSGTLTSVEVIRDVGFFNEEFFIAYVDVEWCARANSKGYSFYGIGSVILDHSLGDNRYYLGKIVIPMHSPLRHYYVFRNGILMLKSIYPPIYWKLCDIVQLCRSFIIYLMFGPQKLLRLKLITKGVIDGILNRGGKLIL